MLKAPFFEGAFFYTRNKNASKYNIAKKKKVAVIIIEYSCSLKFFR